MIILLQSHVSTLKKPPKEQVAQQCPYCDHPPVKTASTLRGHVAKAHGLTGKRKTNIFTRHCQRPNAVLPGYYYTVWEWHKQDRHKCHFYRLSHHPVALQQSNVTNSNSTLPQLLVCNSSKNLDFLGDRKFFLEYYLSESLCRSSPFTSQIPSRVRTRPASSSRRSCGTWCATWTTYTRGRRPSRAKSAPSTAATAPSAPKVR